MMMDIPSCHLTTRDHLILERLAARAAHLDTFHARMLRRKVRDSRLYLRDDIPSDVAVLNSWISYRIGSEDFGPHQLVELMPEHSGQQHISVHTVRGLALLGMTEGSSVRIETEEGEWETVRLDRVQQLREYRPAGQATGEVVTFRARTPPPATSWSPGDDPGPGAA